MPKGLVRTAVLVAAALLGAALVVAPGGFIVLLSERDRFAAAQRAHTQLLLAEAKVALEASLTARLASLRALAAFAASRPEAAQPEFAVFAKGLAASLPDIRSVQLARDFVVTHLSPASRDSGILGLDLLARLPKAQLAAVERAIAADAAVLDGPMPLLQGGLGLILRQPVFAPREPGQPDSRWGLATIILDADAFFALAPTPDGGIRLAIRSLGDPDQPGRLLFGPGAVFEDAPALLTMGTPDGIWQLAAIPAQGWSALPVPPTLLGGGFAAWLALSAAVFVLLARPTRRKAAVAAATARREGEQSLRLLRAAVEQSPASIVITNAKGRIQYVNPYFTELTGYSAEEAQGKTPRVLSSGHHGKDFFQAMWQTLLAGNIWRGELCNRKRDGDLYWEDSSISPIRDDQGLITHFVAVKEDITAQKEREARLHRLMTEFEAIFNASSVGIVHLGADGRVVRANRHFGALFGLDPESLAGRSLEAIHEAEQRRAALRREILEAVAEGREASVEERFHTRSGQVLWCSIQGRRIAPASPEAGSLWIFDDITARKDLEAIREDVERIMRHDLKTPLNSILNLPELVAALGETTQEQRDILGEIEQAGRVMLEQIELSLDLYKMETGAYVPDVQRIDLARILASAADMLAPLAKARGLTLALPTDQPPVFARGNALLAQTIAGNLLKNALEAESAGTAVTVRLFSEYGRAGFAVSNPSPVPTEIVPIFFEKYVTSGKRGGSGLGTYSARLMTECQGGEIRLDVAPDAGTTVSVRLPTA